MEFVEFASARTSHLFRAACLLTGGWHLAEDLVQETLGKVCLSWRRVSRMECPAAYANTVLVNTFLSHRRLRRASERPSAWLPEAAGADEDIALRLALLDGLALLPARDRAVLVLRYWEDRSVEETADALHVSAGAVRTQAQTAMAARYQTSRPTVRRAIFELAGEGLLSAAQGRGTFVRPRPDCRPILIGGTEHPDLLDDEYDAGRAGWVRDEHPDAAHYRATGTRSVTDTILTGASRDQAEALRIATGEMILYRFQRWRHCQTQRDISLTSISPAHLTGTLSGRPKQDIDAPDDYEPDQRLSAQRDQEEPPGLEGPYEPDDNETDTPRLYDLLAKYGPVSFTTGINARMPRGDELNDLGTEPGIPLLQIKRTMTDPHGRPLEMTLIEAPPTASKPNTPIRTPAPPERS